MRAPTLRKSNKHSTPFDRSKDLPLRGGQKKKSGSCHSFSLSQPCQELFESLGSNGAALLESRQRSSVEETSKERH